jgi:hypothetical protein
MVPVNIRLTPSHSAQYMVLGNASEGGAVSGVSSREGFDRRRSLE